MGKSAKYKFAYLYFNTLFSINKFILWISKAKSTTSIENNRQRTISASKAFSFPPTKKG